MTVYGKLNGDVFANGKLEIQATGQLFGNISSSVFVISEGAIFEGNCKMSVKEAGEIIESSEK